MKKISQILVSPEATVKYALKKMDEGASKIVFVVGKGDKLIGALSDGDIRRWILKGGRISAKASQVMTKSPRFLPEGHTQEEARELVVNRQIECVPVVDAGKHITGAVWWFDFFKDKAHKAAKLNLPGMYVVEPEMFAQIPNGSFMHMTELIGKCLAGDIRLGVNK